MCCKCGVSCCRVLLWVHQTQWLWLEPSEGEVLPCASNRSSETGKAASVKVWGRLRLGDLLGGPQKGLLVEWVSRKLDVTLVFWKSDSGRLRSKVFLGLISSYRSCLFPLCSQQASDSETCGNTDQRSPEEWVKHAKELMDATRWADRSQRPGR